jgi:hypothetical protein
MDASVDIHSGDSKYQDALVDLSPYFQDASVDVGRMHWSMISGCIGRYPQIFQDALVDF